MTGLPILNLFWISSGVSRLTVITEVSFCSSMLNFACVSGVKSLNLMHSLVFSSPMHSFVSSVMIELIHCIAVIGVLFSLVFGLLCAKNGLVGGCVKN